MIKQGRRQGGGAVVKFAKQRLDNGNLLHLFNTLQLLKCFNYYIFCQVLYGKLIFAYFLNRLIYKKLRVEVFQRIPWVFDGANSLTSLNAVPRNV